MTKNLVDAKIKERVELEYQLAAKKADFAQAESERIMYEVNETTHCPHPHLRIPTISPLHACVLQCNWSNIRIRSTTHCCCFILFFYDYFQQDVVVLEDIVSKLKRKFIRSKGDLRSVGLNKPQLRKLGEL